MRCRAKSLTLGSNPSLSANDFRFVLLFVSPLSGVEANLDLLTKVFAGNATVESHLDSRHPHAGMTIGGISIVLRTSVTRYKGSKKCPCVVPSSRSVISRMSSGP
jgi:hypothetical protein